MATYADVMNPNSVEYLTTQANAAQAITIAEIYLSSNGLSSNPQTTSQSNPHLPATILTPATVAPSLPVAVQHEQLGFDNTGEQTLLEIAITNDTEMQAEPLPDATADNNNLGMLTDDEPFLQIGLRQEEVDQLYEEAMEEPLEILEDGGQPQGCVAIIAIRAKIA